MNKEIQNIISRFQMDNHPEGGFYKETFRSKISLPESSLPENFTGNRSLFTEILYLLPSESFSSFHRIKSDESWHFYKGSPLKVMILDERTGTMDYLNLGDNNNCKFQSVVPAGRWFAAACLEDNSFSLVGCTVCPGFDYQDFEIASRDYLLKKFPETIHPVIKKYTRQ